MTSIHDPTLNMLEVTPQPSPDLASRSARSPRRWALTGCLALISLLGSVVAASGEIVPLDLRCEYRVNPVGIDTLPRLSWRVESEERGQSQSAYRILAASTPARLAEEKADLWDSGKVDSARTLHIVYHGKKLASGQACHWKVRVWDQDGTPSTWSQPAQWSMGLLTLDEWKARWISRRDRTDVHRDREKLRLPPPHHYRKEFKLRHPVKRALLHASALGIVDLYLNGKRIDDRYFTPGWSDYDQRAYYHSFEVTPHLKEGENAVGAILAEGWYSGYVGYGLLVGYGPYRSGRSFYGKTPALLVQLVVEYENGETEWFGTDPSWKVTDQGPTREADLIMGEFHDARREMPGWASPGFDDRAWEPAIEAPDNETVQVVFHDNRGPREVELGFRKPPVLQAYPAQPIRVTKELPTRNITEPNPGVYIFDLGQNFAGVVRLNVKGPVGTRLTLRHGEMLHPDGRLMTENLRRARATDTYILRGDPGGETWSPRFTYHGFQYVEVTGLPGPATPDMVTGLVLHNDTPMTGSFACSDPVLTRFWTNTVWTQRANFIEVPTDCPQRDERLGWMGDAQIYIRTATFNADVAAFFTKWLDDVEEAQLPFGAYPDYCPYPMGHGQPGKSFGTAWTDAGIICPWTLWKVYGDTRVLAEHWDSMTRFMEWRISTSPDREGVSIGNTWGDWLNVNEPTPIEFIDAAYFARSSHLMADMAEALGKGKEADRYQDLLAEIKRAFARRYVQEDGTLSVDTQTAYALALEFGLLPPEHRDEAAGRLAGKITANDVRMTTGFLGTKSILPALSDTGHHDLAVRLFQSRRFPSWGYEVVNGANTVWERWDSFTTEHGFNGLSGNQNASMNSFSHYAFGAVMEWAFRDLAGIDTLDAGYGRIRIRPGPPDPKSNPDVTPIHWVKASYDSIQGRISSEWRMKDGSFHLRVRIPANTQGRISLPASSPAKVRESGEPLAKASHIRVLGTQQGRVELQVDSGQYDFLAE